MTKRGKPTGDTVVFRVQGGKVDKTVVALPATKSEVEDWILDRALRSAARARAPLFDGLQTVRNPEDSFDYTVETRDGPEYVDLMEVFVLPEGTTGSHAQAAAVYSPRDLAERIADDVVRKSTHYGRPVRPVHLLLYSTDWRLHLSPPVAEVVAVALRSRTHVFTTVTYFAPLDAEEGFVFRMWPLAPQQVAEYEGRSRQIVLAMVGDPNEGQARPDGMSFTIDLTKLPKA